MKLEFEEGLLLIALGRHPFYSGSTIIGHRHCVDHEVTGPMNRADGVVGLVPAAGRARRLGLLPVSKELYPIGFTRDSETGDLRPTVASHHLFEKFRRAGVGSAYVILREGKWDIPAFLGEGQLVGTPSLYRGR